MIAFVARDGPSASVVVQDVFGNNPPVEFPRIVAAQSVEPLAFTPDGQSVAILTVDNRIVVGDVSTGKLLRTFSIPRQNTKAHKIALSSRGRWLAVSTESRRGVDIYDFQAGKPRYTLPEREGTVYWLSWDPSDEFRLAIARDNGAITIWNLAKIEEQLEELGLGSTTELP